MEQTKRLWLALGMFAVLAMLAWTLMSNEPIEIAGGHVSLRGLTLVILGFFAVRTVLHWKAERIRAEKEQRDTVGE